MPTNTRESKLELLQNPLQTDSGAPLAGQKILDENKMGLIGRGLPLSGIGRPPISSTIHPPTLAGWCPAGKPSWDRLTLENPPQGPTRTLPPRLENAHPTWIYSIKGGHLGFRFFTPPRSSDLLKHWHYFHEMATKFSPRVTTWPYFGWNFRS